MLHRLVEILIVSALLRGGWAPANPRGDLLGFDAVLTRPDGRAAEPDSSAARLWYRSGLIGPMDRLLRDGD